MTPEDLNAWVASKVAEAPPLTGEQRERLRALLRPPVVVTQSTTRGSGTRRRRTLREISRPPEAA